MTPESRSKPEYGDGLKSFAFSLLPGPVRIQGRSFIRHFLLDVRDFLAGKTDPEVPPRQLNISGDGPFREYGRKTVELCSKYGGLTPSDAVLDVGCGIGRTALALGDFLTTGSYAGFDIINFAVRWCRRHITSKHPNFKFVHADVFNRTYNPRGKSQPEAYRFPFAPESFTFAIATSLFTHVFPATAENYIRETSRVLKPGARFFSTWFLLDEESERALASGSSLFRFPHRFAQHAQAALHSPEQAIAFPRGYILPVFEAHGFTVESVYRGDWIGNRTGIESMQDVIVAVRR